MQSITAETRCVEIAKYAKTVIEVIVTACIPFDPVVIDVVAVIVVVVVVVVVIVVTVRVMVVVSVVVVVECLSCNCHAVVAVRRDVGQACL